MIINDIKPVAVIGAGHAGVEAALACARAGVECLLFTLSLDSIANMPCNPSIGGTGKSCLVYEIDALGGEMGRAADVCTLQSRTLNTGKGAAVRSKRVQADRRAYSAYMKRTLENTPLVHIIQAEVTEIICDDISESSVSHSRDAIIAGANGNVSRETKYISGDAKKRVTKVRTALGEEFDISAAVICAGTYLAGRIHVGTVNYEAGPDNSLPSKGLSPCLERLGVSLRRFKTGTPVRVDRRTIDFDALELQPGDDEPLPFSWRTPEDTLRGMKSAPCHIVYTNERTHDIIRANLTRSAMYSGNIHGTGPRYCPSIEDKIVRFSEKERHQLFVEPTSDGSGEMYLQGMSTSMPPDVQYAMLRSLDGFEHAEIMRYAYAIEYDCADPTQMYPTLEFKTIEGLYGAGQFNGTSGYEEAAAQGLVAGLNAALGAAGRPQLVLTRQSSYTGTLIDDLVTKGTLEPYRIMTSRSEYRLMLRQDNAAKRLTEAGRAAGCVGDGQYEAYRASAERIKAEIDRLNKTTAPPSTEVNKILADAGTTPITTGAKVSDLLRRPEIEYDRLETIIGKADLSTREKYAVQTEIKYDGYVRMQIEQVERRSKIEDRVIPDDVDYTKMTGLRIEAVQKLQKIRPRTIGQAGRISGVSPADITVLLLWISGRG
jgi:tRNA uridine 5-carboxymethylaminomethyl modification enzyme